MPNEIFERNARELVAHYQGCSYDETYVVWLCYILGMNKCLVSTSLHDGKYFEVTYNKDKDVYYFDAYVKELNEEVIM